MSPVSHRHSVAAKRAFRLLIGGHSQTREGRAGNTQVRLARAAVNNGSRGDYVNSGIPQQLIDFPRTATGRNHVFDDNGRFTGLDLKAAAQGHLSVGSTFGENGPRLQSACNLMADDQATHGGRDDDIDPSGRMEFLKRACETRAQFFGVLRMLQYSSALHVLWTVQSAG